MFLSKESNSLTSKAISFWQIIYLSIWGIRSDNAYGFHMLLLLQIIRLKVTEHLNLTCR